METIQTEIKQLKEGRYVMIDDEPCIVVNINISKPGKHGSAKARVEANGLFDGKRRVIMGPASDAVHVPVIEKRNAQVIADMGNNKVQLMDMESFQTFEVDLPPEMKGLETGKEVLYWKFGSKMMLKSSRESSVE